MEKIINKLIEAENKAHELINKARLDKEWAVELRQKEFNTIRKKRYSELQDELAAEIEKVKADIAAENEALTQKHIAEKQRLAEKYAEVSEQLIDKLFNKVAER